MQNFLSFGGWIVFLRPQPINCDVWKFSNYMLIPQGSFDGKLATDTIILAKRLFGTKDYVGIYQYGLNRCYCLAIIILYWLMAVLLTLQNLISMYLYMVMVYAYMAYTTFMQLPGHDMTSLLIITILLFSPCQFTASIGNWADCMWNVTCSDSYMISDSDVQETVIQVVCKWLWSPC